MRRIIGTNNIDHHRTGDYASLEAALALKEKREALLNVEQIKTARNILVIGDDSTTQQPLVAFHLRFAVRRHNARLFIVNSKRIKLLRNAVASLLVKEGSEAMLVSYLARRGKSLEEASAETGLSTEAIETFEKELRTAEDVAVIFGAEIRGGAVHDLVEFAGALPGAPKFLALSDFSNSRGAMDMGVAPQWFPGYAAVSHVKTLERFEQAWNGKLPADAGLSQPEMLQAIAEGELKALLVFGANPAAQYTHPQERSENAQVVAALEKLDLLVVSDLFLTETAQQAHVVFPAAAFAEKDGTMTNCGGQVQRLQRALLSPFDVRSDLHIIIDLARALGADDWFHVPWTEVLKEIAALHPGYALVTGRDLMQGQIPCTALAATKEALPDMEALNRFAESIRANTSRSLYASGSLASHSHTLVQLQPRADVQQAFVEKYQM
jgi:NADH-quinone oxidoreductase subunit G